MIGIDCPWCGDEIELDDVMAAAIRCEGCATEIEFGEEQGSATHLQSSTRTGLQQAA